MAEQPNISPNASHLALPLEQLLDELVAAGFARDRVGTPLRLRLQALLNDMAPETLAEQLKYKLSALICQSAAEQEKFYTVFESFSERFRPLETLDAASSPDKKADAPPAPEAPKTPRPESTQKPTSDTSTGAHKTDSVKAARSGPITVELHFRDDGYRPWNLPELESVVRPMREKEWTGAEEWDIPKTISQTIQAGGAPHFTRRRRRKAPQYLFLIEQKSTRDHLAGFYADLVLELQRRDLDAECYFYDKLPQKCWKDRRDPSSYTTLDALNTSHQQSRLILIGEPNGFLAVTQEPTAKKDQLSTKIHRYPSPFAFQLQEDWPAVAMLNTRSTAQWGDAEMVVHQIFPIAPANLTGLGSLMEQWKNRTSYQPYYWKTNCPEPMPPTIQFFDGSPETIQQGIKNLKLYLGRQGYTWLCAIAVYPEIYWQLTKILHDEAISQADVPDESLRTQLWHLYLLRLSRLEWLRRGYIPAEYRNELRKGLPDANAAEVRRQLLEILRLDENKAPEGSYAEKDRVYTVALFDYERYAKLENPDQVRLSAMQEKLKQDVLSAGVAVSDIEDAVGRNLFRNLPETPVETVKNFWVLWVDDSPDNNLKFQQSVAEGTNLRFVNVTNTAQAIETLKTQQFDIILSDVSRFGDKESGIKMMRRFQELGIALPTYFFTHPNYVKQHQELLMSLGAVAVMTGFEQLRPELMEAVRRKEEGSRGELVKIKLLEAAVQLAKSVCRVVVADKTVGTGFLTAGNYLFTCNHVIHSQVDANNTKVEFSVEKDESGNAKQVYSYALDSSDFIFSPTNELNFTRVKVIDREDTPLRQWGYIDLEASSIPEAGVQIVIIHHPRGESKQVEVNKVLGVEGVHYYYGENSDSSPGSSGAPLITELKKTVAMHQSRKDNALILGKERTVREGILFRDIIAFIDQQAQSSQSDTTDPNAGLLQQARDLLDQGQEAYQNKNFELAQSQLQQSLELYTQAQDDAGRGNCFHELGKVFIETKRLEEAKQSLDSAYTLYLKLEFNPAKAFVLMDLGKVETMMGALDSAEKDYLDALDLLLDLSGDADEDIIECWLSLGGIAQEKGEYEKAKSQGLNALDIARKSELKGQEFEVLNQLGSLHIITNELEQALKYFENALQLAPTDADRGRSYEDIAHIQGLLNQPKKAIEALNEAFVIYAKTKDTESSSRITRKLQELATAEESQQPFASNTSYQQNAPPETSQQSFAYNPSYEQTAEAEPPMQSLFEPDLMKLYILSAPEDQEFSNGLERHLLRLKESDKISVFNATQPHIEGEDILERARFELDFADYVLVMASPDLFSSKVWLGLIDDAIGLSKKIIRINIRNVALEVTELEKIEALPRSSRNKSIAQFEDREDGYFVVAREIGEILWPVVESPKEEAKEAMTSRFLPNTTKLFIHVSEDDVAFYQALSKHLIALKRGGKISTFSYFDLMAGEEWKTRLRFEMDQADYFLPLVSINLINSDATYNVLKEALQSKKRVIPILVGKVDLEGTGLEKLRSLPSQGRYVSDFRDQDEAYTDIVAEIKRLLSQEDNMEQPIEDINTSDISQQIRELIGKANLREALDLLQKAMPNENDAILLKGRLSELERSERMGVINRREANIIRNQITAAALELINDIPGNRKKTMK